MSAWTCDPRSGPNVRDERVREIRNETIRVAVTLLGKRDGADLAWEMLMQSVSEQARLEGIEATV